MQTTKGKLMRTQLITANKSYFKAQIEKHRINIEVMLNNPTAIPEHSNIMEAIENEIQHMAEYMDKLEVIEKYFTPKPGVFDTID